MERARRLHKPRFTAWLLALLMLVCALPFSALLDARWDFGLIIQRAEQRYGQLGRSRERLVEWSELVRDGQSLSEQDKLQKVNAFFNRSILFIDDARNWRQTDYWATPVESLVKGAGDCEDYAIAKYLTLRQLGVPLQKLRITYVKALELNQAHMVLAWYATPTADPLILDNLRIDIRPASQRRDLLPVYSFNAEGLWLPGPGGGKRTGSSKQLSRWQDLLKKMRGEGFALNEGQE